MMKRQFLSLWVLMWVLLLVFCFWVDSCSESPVVTPEARAEDLEKTRVENYSKNCSGKPPEQFDHLVQAAAKSYKINPRVLALTVYRESGCRSHVVGKAGEIGLGQIHPRVWEKTLISEGIIGSRKDLYDPETNLRASAFVLSEMSRRAGGNPQETLRRYNGAGPAARKYARVQEALYGEIWKEELWVEKLER
jgi:soluble lytic murein transglycosylase-like protein